MSWNVTLGLELIRKEIKTKGDVLLSVVHYSYWAGGGGRFWVWVLQ